MEADTSGNIVTVMPHYNGKRTVATQTVLNTNDVFKNYVNINSELRQNKED